MRGFDPDFADLPDYILKITERIWEGRGVDLIRRFYSADCILRTPGGVLRGAEAVVQSTLETLNEFPDRRLLGEDVVWSGDEDAGFYSSHRILSTMHHLGDGRFGTATGRPVMARTIADCAVRENQVYDEWLVRDQGAIARQLGQTPRDLAAAWLAAERAAPAAAEPPSVYPGHMADGPAAARYGDGLRRIWGDAEVAAVAELYHPAAALALPGGVSSAGHDGMERFCLGYLAALPGAAFDIEHLILREDAGQPARLAARWTLSGTHDGHGAYGAPTGAPVRVMGISQAHLVDGQIVAEWVLVDEVAVWQQILRAAA